ncbi:Proteinase inhibitor I35 [Aphelenchoides avenae]|nr:Proteinase inhibitor I35 [Aphelenchus avenae]
MSSMPSFSFAAFAVFLLYLTSSEACKCLLIKQNDALCEAKWISQGKILDKKVNDMFVTYTVQHVKTFKSALESAAIVSKVQTPRHTATCGVPDLQENKEYLLAGTVANRTDLRLVSCLVIPAKDGQWNEGTGSNGVLEWEKVPEDLRKKLNAKDYSSCPQ